MVFGSLRLAEAADEARRLGFDHIDVIDPRSTEFLALPVGDRIAFPGPRAGCTSPAPPRADGAWERAVAAYRSCPGARIEPWPGSILDSIAACREMIAAVPGLKLTLDTGHVACWGEDPTDLAAEAAHVQLRQARRGQAQTLDGDVEFAHLFRRLRDLDYRGRLSIEYFDLPEMGWPLEDPLGHALALADQVRALL